MDVRVGTAGWSYRDWIGPVYPEGLSGAEQLPYFARRLATVEVNSTFYRTPSRPVVEGWVERTRDEPGFEFTVKAPKELTQTALAKAPPSECARLADEWREAVVAPLADAGRVGALLLQLSPGVLHNRESIERIDAALERLHDHEVALELRNKTWLDPGGGGVREDALQLLDAHDTALVMVDGPSFPLLVEGHASHAYVRLHGRNADVWNRGYAVDRDPEDPRMNRYDYFYSAEALRPWADRVAAVAKDKPGPVRVYFNNHPGGQAFHNAKLFNDLLSTRLPAGAVARATTAGRVS